MSTRFKGICYRAWIALSVLWVALSLFFLGGESLEKKGVFDQPSYVGALSIPPASGGYDPYAGGGQPPRAPSGDSWTFLLVLVSVVTFVPPLALRWLGRTVVWIAGDRP